MCASSSLLPFSPSYFPTLFWRNSRTNQLLHSIHLVSFSLVWKLYPHSNLFFLLPFSLLPICSIYLSSTAFLRLGHRCTSWGILSFHKTGNITLSDKWRTGRISATPKPGSLPKNDAWPLAYPESLKDCEIQNFAYPKQIQTDSPSLSPPHDPGIHFLINLPPLLSSTYTFQNQEASTIIRNPEYTSIWYILKSYPEDLEIDHLYIHT